MAVFISQLENTTPLGTGGWTSDDVLTDRTTVLGVLASSDNNLTLNFNWSNDGISTVLTESETITGGTPQEFFKSIKAKYIHLQLVNGGTNTSLVIQSFFFDVASATLAIRNLGTGIKIANLSKIGLRSLKSSDASITITNTADEIDLVSAGGGATVQALNENVQVTEAPAGQFNVGTGLHDAGALTLGWNVPFPVTTGTGGVNLGDGRSTGASCVAIGENCGNNTSFGSVSIGGLAGNNGSASNYAVNIGYSCASTGTHGTETVCIGYLVGLGGAGKWATLIGAGSAYAGSVPQETVAIGRASLLNGCTTTGINPPVAVGSEAGLFASTLNATGNVMLGHRSLYNITKVASASSVGDNVVVGRGAGQSSILNDQNILIGSLAGEFATHIPANGENTIVGMNAGRYQNMRGQSVLVGKDACNPLAVGGEVGQGCVSVGYKAHNLGCNANAIAIGNNSGSIASYLTPAGTGSICIGAGSGNSGTIASNEILIGQNCSATNTAGRLSFASMETPVTISTSSIEAPTKLISMNWNGTNYRIPVLSNTATDLKLTNMMVMPLGEVAYQDHVTPTTITVSAANTPYLINVASTLTTNSSSLGSAFFDSPSNGRLRYLGSITQKFHLALSIDVESAGGANKLWSFSIYKNGTFWPRSDYELENPGTQEFTMASHIIVELATNDYVECYFENRTDTSNLVVHNLNITCMGSIGA